MLEKAAQTAAPVRNRRIRSIKSYARDAYMNRYVFDSVTVGNDGLIRGHWKMRNGTALDPVDLGHIGNCQTSQTTTGVRFYNNGALIYTFGLPA